MTTKHADNARSDDRRQPSAGKTAPPPTFTHYRIGPFEVAVRSDLTEAAADFDHLYQHCRLGEVAADQLDHAGCYVVEAERRGSWWGRSRYTILGDREEIFIGRRRDEVLPYLEWAVNWRVMARAEAYCQLHAATLSFGGAGLLFAAGSGSGKSTLAAGALAEHRRAAGWRLLSDEFALVDRRSLALIAFPKALCIKAGSFDVVRGLGLPIFARRHYAKATKGRVGFISPAQLTGEVVGPPCPLRAIFFPQYVGDTTPSAEPLARADAVERLCEMLFNRHHLGPEAIVILARIAAGARCWRLSTGRLEPTLDLVQSLMADHVLGAGDASAAGQPDWPRIEPGRTAAA